MSGSSDGSGVFDVGEFVDRPRFGAYRLLIFALCTLVVAVDGHDVFVVGYLVPALAQDFGVPLSAVTSIFVFQAIGLGLGAYAVSRFADRFGRRKIVLICTALLGLIGVAGADATLAAIGVFCAGLFVIGGRGGINALASMLCPTEMRATGVGCALGAGRVASVFGPMAGGAMLKGQWSAGSIFATISMPAFIAALATICVRFSRRPGTALSDRSAVVEGQPAIGIS